MTRALKFVPFIGLFINYVTDTIATPDSTENSRRSNVDHSASDDACKNSHSEDLFGSQLQKDYQNGFTEILQIFEKMNKSIEDLNKHNNPLQHWTGYSETYDFNNSTHKGGCHNLSKDPRRIKSVDTQGTCVRIFSVDYCLGFSQAIYPGSSDSIDPKLNGVASVGPCVKNEFENAILEDSEKYSCQKVVRKSEAHLKTFAVMPDKMGDSYTQNSPAVKRLSDNDNPLTLYLIREGRQEFLNGISHIVSEEIVQRRISESRRLSFYQDISLNPETDEVGYAFPVTLGGPTDQKYNCFAQNKNQRSRYESSIVPQITQFLAENPDKWVWQDLTLFYAGNSTRPSGIWYRIHKSELDEITYDYWAN
ncbi:unnamed protein product [Allacma fusca]|uniref:Uncharacterized protein n=1 Tax=Allacma fusca TaxID=39272 RepID=A0A8J2JW30_9HEXA|nr:unnamed protein product [Allacma fusca]